MEAQVYSHLTHWNPVFKFVLPAVPILPLSFRNIPYLSEHFGPPRACDIAPGPKVDGGPKSWQKKCGRRGRIGGREGDVRIGHPPIDLWRLLWFWNGRKRSY